MSQNNSNLEEPEEQPAMLEVRLPPQSIHDLLVQPVENEEVPAQYEEQPVPEANNPNSFAANVAGIAALSLHDNEIHKKLMRRIKIEDETHSFCCGLLDRRDNFCVHIIKLFFATIIFPFIFLCKSGELFLDVCLDPCCIKLDQCIFIVGRRFNIILNYITKKICKCFKKLCSCFKTCCNKACRPLAYTCDMCCIGIDTVLTCIGSTILKIVKKTAKKIKPCTDALAACTRAIYNKVSKYVSCLCSRVKMLCDLVMELLERMGHLILKIAIRIKTHVVNPMIKFLKAIGRTIMRYLIYPIVKMVLSIWRFVQKRVIRPTYAAMSRCVKAKRFALRDDTTTDEETQQPINQP